MNEGNTRALVIGGSMAGLLAARVLSERFNEVVLVERDTYPATAAVRDGVPQGRHLHALLARGQVILEGLFPGITEEWCAYGAELIDPARDFAWFTPAGWGARFDSGLRFVAASRPLLEFCVRRRVAALPNVRFIENSVVQGVASDRRAKRICGAAIRTGDEPQARLEKTDLIVDASGRTSRTPEWLQVLGYEGPAETVITAHLGYASRIYRRTPQKSPWRALFIQAAPPERIRSGIAFPIEGDRWMVTLCGGDADYAPVEENAFLDFARSLPDDQLYTLLRSSEPLSPIAGYRRMENRWRHYERMRAMPGGFVVLGDAACAFNPVYGQGMTTAAIGALVLRHVIDHAPGDRLPLVFQRELARVIRTPWMLATGEDLRYRNVEGAQARFTERLMHGYLDRVVELGTRDAAARLALLRVFMMLDEPRALFRPETLFKVAKGRRRSAPRTHAADSYRPTAQSVQAG